MEQRAVESRASRLQSGGGCLTRIAAVMLLIVSIGVGLWSFWTYTPWEKPTTRPVAASEHRPPHTSVNPYSVNTFLSQEVEPWKRERTVEMIADAGIGWIKEGFPWSEIEPAEGSHWDAEYQQDSWEKFDRIVDLAEEHGLRIIARLDHPPDWAMEVDTDFQAPPADVKDYGRFVEAFVERYRGRVQHIQIWNEPNLAREWGGEIDPNGYFELLREAYTRAKSADPNVVVLSAPMAMTNEQSGRAVPEFEYWEELYQLGADDYFDVMTATGYGIDQPPEEAPSRDTINLRRIELLREVMEQHDDTDKPVWLTEYGWNASPETVPQDRLTWGTVTDDEQAAWTARGIEWMDRNWDWFGVASIWYFRQVGLTPPDEPEYYFAMVDLEFTPRPVYLSVLENAQERRIALPGSYGPLEGPAQHSGTWSRFDDDQSPFGQSIVGDSTDAELRIAFSGSDLRIRTSNERELTGRMYVEINGSPPEGDHLEHTDNGRAFVDLDDSAPGEEIEIITDHGVNRPQQTNDVVLTLDQGSTMTVSSVSVDYQRSYVRFSLVTALAALGLLGAIMLFRR